MIEINHLIETRKASVFAAARSLPRLLKTRQHPSASLSGKHAVNFHVYWRLMLLNKSIRLSGAVFFVSSRPDVAH